MEATASPGYWWLKSSKAPQENHKTPESRGNITSTPKQTEDPSTISSSLQEFLEKERAMQSPPDADTDIGSIIEEINKLAAQSPLGPYEKDAGDRSVEEIMKEAEKIYLESSKSFEQLSGRSHTSANLSVSFNDSAKSTPTPKSASPLPLDIDPAAVDADTVAPEVESEQVKDSNNDESYSDDFTQDEGSEPGTPSAVLPQEVEFPQQTETTEGEKLLDDESVPSDLKSSKQGSAKDLDVELIVDNVDKVPYTGGGGDFRGNEVYVHKVQSPRQEATHENKEVVSRITELERNLRNQIIEKLEEENKYLLDNVNSLKAQLETTNESLAKTRDALTSERQKSPELNIELEKALEELKDAKETNTVLQLQLNTLNQTHLQLKSTYEELLTSNNSLERRVSEAESVLSKYKSELQSIQQHRDKLSENEASLSKLLEVEKLQVKSLKAQSEKDARCILDLNRQVKEMERIIARKHPDSVSALIVAAKNDHTDNNLTARRLLEDRIRNLEGEVAMRDQSSSKVFMEVQEKFTEMKSKYESHIEDLEVHVSDLKSQLKRKADTFDVYTQTISDEQKIPGKETKDASSQTRFQVKIPPAPKKPEKVECKDDAHLLATIRGLQADLVNKEKVIMKLQKELDEARKTNRRLQKEREGSLKNIAERREFRSYPEKLTAQAHPSGSSGDAHGELAEELRAAKAEKDKMRIQLCRMEEDYQNLKTKRLFDLSALQQAHENEIATYMANIAPLQEQLERQQATVHALQEQLHQAKENVEILTVERDDLNKRLYFGAPHESNANAGEGMEDLGDLPPHKKIALMEYRYREREARLRAIVHGLAQKNIANISCQQCAARQQQLIVYKTELDQLLATLRTLA